MVVSISIADFIVQQREPNNWLSNSSFFVYASHTIARNNPTLRAAQAGRQAAEAANRTDTRLPDPEAEVAYLVGSPKGVPGRTNVSLTQSLDWGVLTKRRQLLAEAADRTAASQYRETRRVVLGEALQQLVLLIHANRTLAELDSRLSLACQVEQLCQRLAP